MLELFDSVQLSIICDEFLIFIPTNTNEYQRMLAVGQEQLCEIRQGTTKVALPTYIPFNDTATPEIYTVRYEVV